MKLNQIKQHVKDYLAGKIPERDHCNPELNWIEALAEQTFSKIEQDYKNEYGELVTPRKYAASNWQVKCNKHQRLACLSCVPESLDDALRNYTRYTNA